jgi:PAS domain S-box-containing protein
MSWLFQPAEQHIRLEGVDAGSMSQHPALPAPTRRMTAVDSQAVRTHALQDLILSSACLCTIATDENGVIKTFSGGAERMLGYAAGDVVDKATAADLCDPDELAARAATLSRAADSSISAGFEAMSYEASRSSEDVYELTCLRKDGTRLPVVLSVTSLRNSEKRILGYLLIAAANTASQPARARHALLDQRLRVQQSGRSSLRASHREALGTPDARGGGAEVGQQKDFALERASRIRSDFLATMSHELRTPLNAIIGFSEALEDGLMGPMSGSQRECIGDILTSGQHLLSMVNDILHLSELEAGHLAVELELVDLHDLLADSLAVARRTAADRGIELALDVDEDLGRPLLDEQKTKRILQNLLSNAVKFSACGGRVTLRARTVSRHCVGRLPGSWPVHRCPGLASTLEDFLEITVADAGIGIAEGDMPRLFRTFSQIDSSLTRQFQGTGVGLAVVRRLAEVQGGVVAVASAVGEGAIFAAWLPLRGASGEREMVAPAGSASAYLRKPVTHGRLQACRDERSCGCLDS